MEKESISVWACPERTLALEPLGLCQLEFQGDRLQWVKRDHYPTVPMGDRGTGTLWSTLAGQ